VEEKVKTTIIEKEVMKTNVPAFRVGDTLKISLRVKEGDKTRTQIFEGTCIRRRGTGANASFTVLKETHGDIVEKIFPLYSPTIEKIAVSQKGKAHHAKLYHLRKKK
jgi:large subunit ribosomal protein L19